MDELIVEPIVELKGVSKNFGSKVILDRVDLKIYPGESVGVIGPSGTGKSTILRAIAGLMKLDAGKVWVNLLKQFFTASIDGPIQ